MNQGSMEGSCEATGRSNPEGAEAAGSSNEDGEEAEAETKEDSSRRLTDSSDSQPIPNCLWGT